MERKLDSKYFISSLDEATGVYEDKTNTALLVIDEQPRLMNAMENGEETVVNTVALIDAFDKYDMHVIATEQYPKGLGKSDDRILERIDEEKIFEKSIFDAAIPEVIDYFKENNITNVVITGAEGHICVYQTVRSLVDLGYNVLVVEDAVSSFKESQKQRAITTFIQMGAVIVNTEMALFDIARDSKDEHFKFISNLIKEMRARD